jgi:hypothetical protein
MCVLHPCGAAMVVNSERRGNVRRQLGRQRSQCERSQLVATKSAHMGKNASTELDARVAYAE